MVRGWRPAEIKRYARRLATQLIAALLINIVAPAQDIVPAQVPKTSSCPYTTLGLTESVVLTTFQPQGHPLFVQPMALFPAVQIGETVGLHPSIALARTLERSKPLPREHEGMASAADTWHQTASEQYVKTTNVAAFSHIAALDPIFAPTAPVLPG